MKNSALIFVGDFETTVYEGQEETEVWASALVQLYSDDAFVHNCIEDTFNYLVNLKRNIVLYYHNLKFDGSFWISYLMNKTDYTPAVTVETETPYVAHFDSMYDLKPGTFVYMISDRGQWYTLTIRTWKGYSIYLRDSFKLLPFSVKRIGQSFHTKHQKLEIEYEGKRHAKGYISPDEQQYIKNDVLIIKEALEMTFANGDKKLTIGSCCLAEYKKLFNSSTTEENQGWYELTEYADDFEQLFPNLQKMTLNSEIYGESNADAYIRKAYRGGWCYLKSGCEDKVYKHGCTVDVNSLYPSVMHSKSGNIYPYGYPTFWSGNYIPDKALGDNKYYYLKVRCSFHLKAGYLPCIQIKHNVLYKPTKYLETSDIYNSKTGIYEHFYRDYDGNEKEITVVLTLSMTDWELIQRHYILSNVEILNGCWFNAKAGFFDPYIDKYMEIKTHSKGAIRERAKLYLNNLYGKLATSPDSSFKVAYTKEDGTLYYKSVREANKTTVHIGAGAAITAYARYFTITHAQENYKYFIYADTDSIHCNCNPDQLKGIEIHPTDFLCWKIEGEWDEGKFLRQKTYIEHIIKRDNEACAPFYELKCAGMTAKCKELFNLSVTQDFNLDEIKPNGVPRFTNEEKEFLKTKRTLNDFKLGLSIPSKLYSKQIPGGTVLFSDYMTIHD